MKNVSLILMLVSLWGGLTAVAIGQDGLPEDVRQALPGLPKALPLPHPAAGATQSPSPSLAPSLAPSPAPESSETLESPEQLLERAIVRYRNILEQGGNVQWEADATERLNRLEAFLKTLQKEAEATAKPSPAPSKKPATAPPDRVPSPVIPASGVEPSVVASSVPSPGPAKVAMPIVDPSLLDPLPAPVAGQQPEVPAAAPVPAPPLTAPAAVADRSGNLEVAKQLEQMAMSYQRLTRDLLALAEQLRNNAPAQKTWSTLKPSR